MNTRRLLISVLMLVSVLLAACAPASETPELLTSDPNALATVAGNYTYNAGLTFNFSLVPDGSYRSLPSNGTFLVTADEITFLDDGSSCRPESGVYKWSLDNNVLRLTLIQDDCQSRVQVFGSQGFEKTQTAILPSAGKVIAIIPVGARPLPLVVGEGAVWVKNGSGDVLRIDLSTNQVVATIHVGGGPYGYITVGEGAVWASLFDSDMVVRIDPQTNKVVANIPVGHAPEGIGVTPGTIWVANHHDGSVSRIDPATNKVTNTITDVGVMGRNGPLYLVTTAGAVWVEVPNIGSVVRIDPNTNEIVAKLTTHTVGLAADSGSVWHGTSSGLARVDPATNEIIATVPIQADIHMIAIGLGSVWVATDEGLLRIDSQTNQVSGMLPLPSGGSDVLVGEGSIWVSVEGSQSLLRIEPAP